MSCHVWLPIGDAWNHSCVRLNEKQGGFLKTSLVLVSFSGKQMKFVFTNKLYLFQKANYNSLLKNSSTQKQNIYLSKKPHEVLLK